MTSLNDLDRISDEFPNSPKLPVLFLGHGNPMNAIEENEFVAGFRAIAKTIPEPKAIVCISAHWYTKGTKVTAMEYPDTIHDFGGFPPALYQVQYPAPGNPELAQETKKVLEPVSVDLAYDWGLDHGAWSVLKHLYPEANIPIIQLSLDYTKSSSYHFELGAKLQKLRHKGILIVGSGNIVHNLRMVDFSKINEVDYGYDWAWEARDFVNKQIVDGDFDSIINYEKVSKAMQLAVPTPDHYWPLLYTLGLKTKTENITLFNDKLLAGSLSMTSLKIE